MSEATATIETERPITLGDKLQKLIGAWLAMEQRGNRVASYQECAEQLAHVLATHPEGAQR